VLNSSVDHARHDADAEIVGVIEGWPSLNLAPKGLVNCMLEEDISAPQVTMIGLIRTVTAVVFSVFYCSFRRRRDYDGHCSRDGVKVEEMPWERALLVNPYAT
jgi:hypothetical protein